MLSIPISSSVTNTLIGLEIFVVISRKKYRKINTFIIPEHDRLSVVHVFSNPLVRIRNRQIDNNPLIILKGVNFYTKNAMVEKH